MNVRVAQLLDGARGATGHAVIVDVFRAFTTAAFCIAAGAREIVNARNTSTITAYPVAPRAPSSSRATRTFIACA